MKFLAVLEFATGLFVVAFVLWQIVAPLLRGERPLPMFRQAKVKERPHTHPTKGKRGGMQ